MKKENSDFTAVVREDNEVHILKCKIIDETFLYFQMYNKTKNILTPCFKIPANFGLLSYTKQNKPSKIMQVIEENLSKTSSINRNRLIMYFNRFKLNFLVNQLHK